ncbi:GNAT family N-acetyltransferase [uncultured Tateyamaria sp.]|uniref:GNAT family N-acetyltransferase n=1 Tax=uncultured Tateyamaria sp. TaxID=455651 RepID=UPI00260B4C5F|nr:GNAT family N-acetyltransferase [uncultured Tateyamaria sp.]
MAEIVPLTWPTDGDRVLHLCLRARDYIALETGTGPDIAYVEEAMTDAPPIVPPNQIWIWGAQAGGTLTGIATCLKGYYAPDDWYLGLLLLDPAARGRGLGAQMVAHVSDQARADGGTCLRISVLDANPRGRAFWVRQGFAHEKSTTAGDGQLRHVHRYDLRDDTE